MYNALSDTWAASLGLQFSMSRICEYAACKLVSLKRTAHLLYEVKHRSILPVPMVSCGHL